MADPENKERTKEMSKTTTDTTEDELTVDQWLQIRKEAGLRIDPETAWVTWMHALTLDPYGVKPDLPEEYQQIGREYFASSPGSDVWVAFRDLPIETVNRLWDMHESKLLFPAGVFETDPSKLVIKP